MDSWTFLLNQSFVEAPASEKMVQELELWSHEIINTICRKTEVWISARVRVMKMNGDLGQVY